MAHQIFAPVEARKSDEVLSPKPEVLNKPKYQNMDFYQRPLFWILLGALLLRLWGVSYGLPLFLVNDETPHVYGALKMIELKTLIPALHAEEFRAVLYYPPFLSYFFLAVLAPVIAIHYALSGAPALETYRALVALDPSFLWIAGRAWMAVIGVAGIYVTYRITFRLFGSNRAALFAAAFLALSFYHLQLSHNIRHWLPASVLLAVLWERALVMRGGSQPLRSHLLTGAIAGLAAGGVNTAAAVGIIPPLLAHVVGNGRRWLDRLFSREAALLLAAFAVTGLAAVALYPYGITRAEGAPGAAADIAGRFSLLAEKNIADWLRFLGRYVRTLWEFETPLFLASLAGAALFWVRRSPPKLAIPESWGGKRFWVSVTVIYAVAFFTLLYLFDDFTARGVVFVTPIFAAFAGYAVDVFHQRGKAAMSRLIAKAGPASGAMVPLLFTFDFLLLTSLFGWPLAVDLRYQFLQSRPDTRLVAREWLLTNLPPDARVVMDAQYLRLPNIPDGVRLVAAIDPGALRAADRAVLALGAAAPQSALAALNLDLVASEIRRRLTADPGRFSRDFTHLVIEYQSSAAIREDVRHLAGQGTKIAHFSPWADSHPVAYDGSGKLPRLSLADLWDLERFGYFVDVYRFPSLTPNP